MTRLENPHPPETPTPGTETEAADDAIIGKAFRWSLVVVVLLATLAGGGLLLTREKPREEKVLPKEVGPIEDLAANLATLPRVIFKDVTAEAGITFVHENGARGEKLLPETMGSGCAFLDFDGDADQDFLFVNAAPWPEERSPAASPTMALYRNDGAGHFVDATAPAGLAVSYYGTGVATGDYDNDGDTDLFIAALGPNHLYRNDGGRFTEVTSTAGVAGGGTEWSTSSGFFDYDNDGDLDLFVCNYVRWSREIDIKLHFTLNGSDRAYGPPTNYMGTYPYLYRNEGDGTFTDVSASAGLQIDNPATGMPMAKALGIALCDVDKNGFVDVIVANDTVQNFLFRNEGDGTFREDGVLSGIAFDRNGSATGAMGIDAAHYRNDDALGVAIGNFANEMTSFYVAERWSGFFEDETIVEGIGSPSRLSLTFGLLFFDCDLDGRLDLFQVNGHLEETINEIQPSQHYRQAAQLFWNAGREAPSCYALLPEDLCGDLALKSVGRGSAVADIDGDGDLDLVLTQAGDRPRLLRNDLPPGRHWLRLSLAGRRCNRDAFAAWVELRAGGFLQRRQVMPARSYLSQSELPITFGLGEETRIESLRILWPDGTSQEVEDVPIDTYLRIEQAL
ncbi:MAG: CRTAC1 family protein [Planctomycetota bacterium]